MGAEREAVHTAACFLNRNDVLLELSLIRPAVSMNFCRCWSLLPSRRAEQRRGDGVNAEGPCSFDLLSEWQSCRSEPLEMELSLSTESAESYSLGMSVSERCLRVGRHSHHKSRRSGEITTESLH